jgi:hypothetical protein
MGRTIFILCLLLPALPVRAAVWKATVEVGGLVVYAELNDATDPVVALIRVENRSKLKSIPISEYFVQMVDGEGRRLRPVTADDVVSEHLERIRSLLPRYASELDRLVGSIRADYPQEKIVTAYARLRNYFSQGRPVGWRAQVESWLLAKRESTPAEVQAAQQEIEAIGEISRNYLWPRDLAPQATYTGTLYFERSAKDPVSIYFQVGEDFLGTKMTLASGAQPGPGR